MKSSEEVGYEPNRTRTCDPLVKKIFVFDSIPLLYVKDLLNPITG